MEKRIITPIGNVQFTPSARRFINRSNRNKLFWKNSFDRYIRQDWGNVTPAGWEYNDLVLKRYTCTDIEAIYPVPDNSGYLLVRGIFDYETDLQTTVNFVPYPAENEEKKRGKLIKLKILY